MKNIFSRIIGGAIAGGLATLAMKAVDRGIYALQDTKSRVKEQTSEIKSAERSVVDKAARAAHVSLNTRQRENAAKGLNWALGIAAGVVTNMVRRRWAPNGGLLRGLAFGAMSFIVIDEILKPRLGITRGLSGYPWQTHARRLVSHSVYGMVNTGARHALATAF